MMYELAEFVAQFLYAILPGGMRLPGLTFVMPHTLYWAGLILFPLVAMYLVRREENRAGGGDRVSGPISYLLWISGGFVGLHRFYLRAGWVGFGYVVLFLLVLYGNKQGTVARNFQSEASNAFRGAKFDVERFAKAVARGRDGAAAKLEQAKETLITVKAELAGAEAVLEQWHVFAGAFAAVIAVMLIVDAFRIPALRRRCNAREAGQPSVTAYQVMWRGGRNDPRSEIHYPVTRVIDRVSGATGNFVAYWSVIAVFVYYYEVIARYVFNSPTNWAHESMFLMFGMQYLISGAFALREDAHVRVDVLYEMLSERAKALLDIVTSAFFFVFTVTLLLTGMIFAMDGVEVLEVSFTEWAIQYWPVKLTISLGALLLLAQGVAKLIRDVVYYTRQRTAG